MARRAQLFPTLLAVWGFALPACGYTNPGTGSGDLAVVAEAIFDANGDQTQLRAEVRGADGLPRENAGITFDDPNTGESFLLTYRQGPEDFTATVDGYRRRLGLAVELGTAWVEGTLEGPAAHHITNPENGRSRAVSHDLSVQWAAEDGVRADLVIVRLRPGGFATVLTDDRGAYNVPQSMLTVGASQIAVERRHSVVLAGGIPGSSLSLGYAVENDVTLEER